MSELNNNNKHDDFAATLSGSFEIKANVPKGTSAEKVRVRSCLPMDAASKEQADAIGASSMDVINAMLDRSRSDFRLVAKRISDRSKLDQAMDILRKVEEASDGREPYEGFLKELYLFTGEHMQLSEYGWMRPEDNSPEACRKGGYEPLEVLDEVNA